MKWLRTLVCIPFLQSFLFFYFAKREKSLYISQTPCHTTYFKKAKIKKKSVKKKSSDNSKWNRATVSPQMLDKSTYALHLAVLTGVWGPQMGVEIRDYWP